MSSASSIALQPGREPRPVVVAEVRVRRARRHDQVIVGDRAVGEDDGPGRDVDGRGLGQDDLDVLLAPEDPADRRGDVARVQRGRRHLVEQGLEQVMVVAVDQDHPDRRPRSARAAFSPPKPAPTITTVGRRSFRSHRFTTEDTEKIKNKRKSSGIP